MRENEMDIIPVGEHNDTDANTVAYELSAFELELVAGGGQNSGLDKLVGGVMDFNKR